MIPQQIGWSQKSKLIWNIARQIETLTGIIGRNIPTTTTKTTLPIAYAYNYVISQIDLDNATGNTDTKKNGSVYINTTKNEHGNPQRVTISTAGTFYHVICSFVSTVPTIGYYKNNVFITTGLVSTQTNGGAC
jgi:hypothetical protein